MNNKIITESPSGPLKYLFLEFSKSFTMGKEAWKKATKRFLYISIKCMAIQGFIQESHEI